MNTLVEAGAKEVSLLAIDHINVGAYFRNTLAVDKNTSREEALIDIYRVMRPGEPPTLETAEAMRSEEHTSEPQSLMRISYAVFCLKKTTNNRQKQQISIT